MRELCQAITRLNADGNPVLCFAGVIGGFDIGFQIVQHSHGQKCDLGLWMYTYMSCAHVQDVYTERFGCGWHWVMRVRGGNIFAQLPSEASSVAQGHLHVLLDTDNA